ncbi:MAG: alpha/beta hydrolase [Desulfobacterales bacterium]|jgi:pimeloyl-ACP methyl ester carboxylesterase
MSSAQNYITLCDGRLLGFAEFGDRQGKPVFYFHGFPGSRLEARLADRISRESKIRFIGIDRPGYGLSSLKPGRTFVDWADDVIGLADALGIDRFSILGVSGGGPYAAACACKIPDRLDTIGIICGMGPVDVPGLLPDMPWMYRQGLRIAGRAPKIATILYPFSAFFFRNYPKSMLSIISGRVAEPDKMALRNPELRNVLCASFQAAFRSSLQWPAADVVLYSRPWGFRLEDIRIPVNLWHGEKDRIVPPAMGHHVAETIPTCRAIFYADEGHFSIILNRIHEIWQVFHGQVI